METLLKSLNHDSRRNHKKKAKSYFDEIFDQVNTHINAIQGNCQSSKRKRERELDKISNKARHVDITDLAKNTDKIFSFCKNTIHSMNS